MGVDPSIMGIGPSPAIKHLLKVAGLTLNDIDLVEVSFKLIESAFNAQERGAKDCSQGFSYRSREIRLFYIELKLLSILKQNEIIRS